MRSIGSILLICGLVSATLKLFFPYMVVLVLMWVDNWGNGVGWAIRIGCVVVGGLLLLASRTMGRSPQSRRP
jgi:hypothetical protein